MKREGAAARSSSAATSSSPAVVALRSAAAVSSGLLLFASFPPRQLWFLAPIGIALLVLVLTGVGGRTPSKKSGFGYGYLAGLGFFVPLLPWIGVYVGPLPWLALAAAESVFIGLFGVLAIVLSPSRWWPLSIALAWSLIEWARSTFPFGGFPWGRLAFGQPDGWLLPLASLGGAPLLSFGVALTGCGIAALVHAGWRDRTPRRWLAAVAVTLAASQLSACSPAHPTSRVCSPASSTA